MKLTQPQQWELPSIPCLENLSATGFPCRAECVQMGSVPNTQKAREDLLQSELTANGKFCELLNMNVPFAVNPEITLTAVRPQV
jgi:hypothetical protein